MKTKVTLLALAWLASGVAFAADTPATPAAQTEAGPGMRGPDMDRLALLLDLDAYQKTEVEKILKEQHEQMRASFEAARASGTKPSRDEMKAQREQSKQELQSKLSAVLTPEQLKKFEALRERGPGPRRFGKGGHEKDDSTSDSSTN